MDVLGHGPPPRGLARLSELVVRLAGAQDEPAATALLRELGRPDPGPRPQTAFRHYLWERDHHVLLAEEDGVVVGLASLVVRPRLNHATPEAWMPELVVRERRRRGGAGRALVEACADIARSRSCHVLRLECGHARRDAHAFYARLGFADAGRDYRLALR